MFISHSISLFTITPFCILQNTDTPNLTRYQLQACKAVANYTIHPVLRMFTNPNPYRQYGLDL